MLTVSLLSCLQVLTQVSLILLLFGTIVGDFALISDVSARAFKGLAAPETPPAWLVAYDGRGTMCLFALGAVFPLCCLKGMRQVCKMPYEALSSVLALSLKALAAVLLHQSSCLKSCSQSCMCAESCSSSESI